MDKCYADNSANTELSLQNNFSMQNWKEHQFPINYLHIIQLTTELDMVVTKSAAQCPPSLCCVITLKGLPRPRTCKTCSPQTKDRGDPALLKIVFPHCYQVSELKILPCALYYFRS